MKNFVAIIDSLKGLYNNKTHYFEGWSSVTLRGYKSQTSDEHLGNLFSKLETLNLIGILNLRIDSVDVNIDNYSEEINDIYTEWSVHVNKVPVITRYKAEGIIFNFFLTSECCIEWLSKLDALDINNPLNNRRIPLKIVVGDLTAPMGGQWLYFIPNDSKYCSFQEYTNSVKLPTQDVIKDNVHFLTPSEIYIDPALYFADNIDADPNIAKEIYRLTSTALLACIVDIYYSQEKVVINGLKKHVVKLIDPNICIDYILVKKLAEVVNWVYAERISIRKKLFNDRISLELLDTDTLISVFSKSADVAYSQAKDRYDFVILDRKDAYLKELKDLLKDLRGQSDLYAQKIRSLLSNILRDILAAIILVGFTIFTRWNDLTKIDNGKLITYLFTGLSIYYLVSFLFQLITDIADVITTKNELKYWKQASRDLMSENEFEKHLKDSLKYRRRSIWVMYPLIALLYIAVSIGCYKFPFYYKQTVLQENKTKY